MQMNIANEEEGDSKSGNATLSFDLPPKIRPKSYSFIGSKHDAIFKTNISKNAEDPKLIKINSFEKISTLTDLHSHPKTRSLLRDFRKLFMKNKTSMDDTIITDTITATTTTATTTNTVGSKEMENEMNDLNDSIMQLRKKSRSWSNYEAQKIFQKCRKFAEPKSASKRIYSSIRALRNNQNATFMNQIVTKNMENTRSTVYAKVSFN
ncbi:unnamed protein product [Wuchereria bancrofti]|uniref:Uncharacterized protein n=1 Tax=Wuchereria bancrofti TaxID=6293 RepID=A0A3P7E966_WUCBA|nr:unnamed protein product [Wuchereria bancrofti]